MLKTIELKEQQNAASNFQQNTSARMIYQGKFAKQFLHTVPATCGSFNKLTCYPTNWDTLNAFAAQSHTKMVFKAFGED